MEKCLNFKVKKIKFFEIRPTFYVFATKKGKTQNLRIFFMD